MGAGARPSPQGSVTSSKTQASSWRRPSTVCPGPTSWAVAPEGVSSSERDDAGRDLEAAYDDAGAPAVEVVGGLGDAEPQAVDRGEPLEGAAVGHADAGGRAVLVDLGGPAGAAYVAVGDVHLQGPVARRQQLQRHPGADDAAVVPLVGLAHPAGDGGVLLDVLLQLEGAGPHQTQLDLRQLRLDPAQPGVQLQDEVVALDVGPSHLGAYAALVVGQPDDVVGEVVGHAVEAGQHGAVDDLGRHLPAGEPPAGDEGGELRAAVVGGEPGTDAVLDRHGGEVVLGTLDQLGGVALQQRPAGVVAQLGGEQELREVAGQRTRGPHAPLVVVRGPLEGDQHGAVVGDPGGEPAHGVLDLLEEPGTAGVVAQRGATGVVVALHEEVGRRPLAVALPVVEEPGPAVPRDQQPPQQRGARPVLVVRGPRGRP